MQVINRANWAPALVSLMLALIAGCAETEPAFAVPPGPARSVAVDVQLPVYVVSRYPISSFVAAIRIELAKYHVDVVEGAPDGAEAAVEIDLGELTYRQWQSVKVRAVNNGRFLPLGSVRLSDLTESTIEAAAQPVAIIVARYVWGAPPAATHPAR